MDARDGQRLGAGLRPDRRGDDGGRVGSADYELTSPRSSSADASCRRPEMPNFEYTFCRWLFTVRTDRNRRSAMSWLDAPREASAAMSRSRGVSGDTETGAVIAGVRAP